MRNQRRESLFLIQRGGNFFPNTFGRRCSVTHQHLSLVPVESLPLVALTHSFKFTNIQNQMRGNSLNQLFSLANSYREERCDGDSSLVGSNESSTRGVKSSVSYSLLFTDNVRERCCCVKLAFSPINGIFPFPLLSDSEKALMMMLMMLTKQ